MGSTIDCHAPIRRTVFALEFLESLRPVPGRNARTECVQRAHVETDFEFIPFLQGEGKDARRRKAHVGWPTSTNLTVAVPSEGPGCMSEIDANALE